MEALAFIVRCVPWATIPRAAHPSTAPIWPWGLAFNVLLGAGGVVVAVSRLSIPQRTLPRGTRVA